MMFLKKLVKDKTTRDADDDVIESIRRLSSPFPVACTPSAVRGQVILMSDGASPPLRLFCSP